MLSLAFSVSILGYQMLSPGAIKTTVESGSISGSGTCAQYLVSEVHLDQTLIPILAWTGQIYTSCKIKKNQKKNQWEH